MTDDARASYEALYAEWLNEQRLATLHRTTAQRLEKELAALAVDHRKRSGRTTPYVSLEPDRVFGRKK